MPKFKRNTGFRMGFKPYVSEHGSPFTYNARVASIKRGMQNAKREYKIKTGMIRPNFYNPHLSAASPGNKPAARATYHKKMSILKDQYKAAKNAGKKKYTLNPFKAKGFGI